MSKDCMIESGLTESQAERALTAENPASELAEMADELSKTQAMQLQNLEKATEVLNYIDSLPPEKAGHALRALVSSSSSGLKNVRNIEHLTQHYERIYQARLADLIDKFRTSAGRQAREVVTGSAGAAHKTAENNFIKSVYAVSRGESTGNKEMDLLAHEWLETSQKAVDDFNDAAGFEAISKLDQWAMPQSWDAARVKDQFKTADEYADWMANKVDLDKMGADRINRLYQGDLKKWEAQNRKRAKKNLEPMPRPRKSEHRALTPDEARVVLKESWESIVREGRNKTPDTVGTFRKQGTPHMRHAHQRVLHIKDAESWIEINDMLGRGERVFDILMGHLNRMAGDTATMHVMPPRVFEAAKDHVKDRLPEGEWSNLTYTEDMYKVAAGRLEPGDNERLSTWVQGTRNVLTATRLDKAMISAIADTGAGFVVSKSLGLSYTRVLARTFKLMLGNAGKLEAVRMGLGADSWIQNAASNMRMGEASMTGWTAHLAQGVMRVSLLSSWTHAGRISFQQELLGALSDLSDTAFDDLPAKMRRVFTEDYEIDAAKWDAFRSGSKEGDAGLLSLDTDAAIPFHMLMTTYANRAVPTPDARVRAVTTQGYADTHMKGAVSRLGLSFKSFPITIMSNHWMWLAHAKSLEGMNRAVYAGALVGSMTGMGILAQLAYDKVEGKGERRLDKPEQWRDLALEGAVRGGFFSLPGDALLTPYSQYGSHGAIDKTVSGLFPAKDIVTDLSNVTGMTAAGKALYGDEYTGEDYGLHVAKAIDKNVPQPWQVRLVTKHAAEWLKETMGGSEYRKEKRRKDAEERKKFRK